MCDVSLLQSFNTFASGQDLKNQQNFLCNRNCLQVQNPFNQYCLISPPSRLASTTTCDLASDPDAAFLFTDTLAGKIQTLHDLPVLFESFLDAGSTQLWLPHTLDTVNFIGTNNFYNGQRPLPALISEFLVSDDNLQSLAFFNQSGGAFYTLYALDKYGMYRQQNFPNGSPIQAYALIDPFYNIFQSPNGSEQYVLVAGVVYVNTAAGWVPLQFTTNPPAIENMLIAREPLVTATILQSDTKLFFIQPVNPTQLFATGIIFCCFTQNRQHIVVCSNTVGGYTLQVLTSQGAIVQAWGLSNPGIFPNTGAYVAITTGNYTFPGNFSVYVQRPSPATSVQIFLNTSSLTAVASFPANFTITQIVGNSAYVLQSTPNIVRRIDGFTSQTVGLPTIMSSNSTATFFWAIVGTNVSYCIPPSSLFIQPSNTIYLAEDFAVNDEYKMDSASSVLVERWYLGRLFVNLPTQLLTNQVLCVSRHNRFRVILDTIFPATPTSFAYLTFRLERFNDFYVLTSGNYQLTLVEDANLIAGDVYQSNTPDQNSDPDSSQVWSDISVPLCTLNGLYILFRDNLTVRISYNVFNSARFAEWCSQTPEYRSRAIQAQADFCFNNLRTPLSATNLFLDTRCGCVGGTRLLDVAFPGVDMSVNGRLEQVLPCVVDDCAKSFSRGPEQSNAYFFTQDSCSQDLTMCAELLTTSVNTNLRNVTVNQNCGTDPNACLNNAECPIGTVCIGGQCTVSCANDARCIQAYHDPFARCDSQTGRCLFATNTKPSNYDFTMWMIIVGFIVLSLIVFLVILALFVK